MLNRDDFQKSVYERAEQQIKENRQRKKRFVRTVTPVCICLFILTAFFWSRSEGVRVKTGLSMLDDSSAENFAFSSPESASEEEISQETCTQTQDSTEFYQYHKKYAVTSYRTAPLKPEKGASDAYNLMCDAYYLNDYTDLQAYYEAHKGTYDFTEFEGALNKYGQSYFDDGNGLILAAVFDSENRAAYTVTDVTLDGKQLSVYISASSAGVKQNGKSCTHILIPVEQGAYQKHVRVFTEE